MTDPTVPTNPAERPTKTAAELETGDWLAAGQIKPYRKSGLAEVLSTAHHAGRVIFVAHAPTAEPVVETWLAEATFMLALPAEVAETREQGERAKRIAEIRQLADWLERHPEAPMPYTISASEHLSREAFGDGTEVERLAKVRNLAASLGIKTDEHLEDRTRLIVAFGNAQYELVAWHEDGRPAEPKPAQASCTCPLGPEGAHFPDCPQYDPTGMSYTRADSDEDDPTPVSPGRVPLHTGEVTDNSLVPKPIAEHYETRDWKDAGPRGCGVECACGVAFGGFDSIDEAAGQLARHIEDEASA